MRRVVRESLLALGLSGFLAGMVAAQPIGTTCTVKGYQRMVCVDPSGNRLDVTLPDVLKETTDSTKSLDQTCQRDLHVLLTELRPYWPGPAEVTIRTMEYCNDLCQAQRHVDELRQAYALRERIDETMARCQP